MPDAAAVRLSVTLLDSFRYWREQEYFTEEAELRSYDELVARIMGERPEPNEAMLRGTAFHDIMEHPRERYHADRDTYESDGFIFDTEAVNQILLSLPPDRVCEVKMEQQIGDVTLVGIADYMYGCEAGDYKLPKKVHVDKYAESIQWMAYLMMMDGEAFKYHAAAPWSRRGSDVIYLRDYSVFPFYRAKETDQRVIKLVEQFVEFATPIMEAA